MARICTKCGLISEAEEKCPNCGQSFSSAVSAAPAVEITPAPKPAEVTAAPAEPVQPAAPVAVAPVEVATPKPEAQKVHCPGCGQEVPAGDNCSLCGSRLPQPQKKETVAEAPVAPAPEPVAPPAPTAQKAEEVGKWLARVASAGLAALSKFLAQAAEKKPAAPTAAPKPEPKARQANGKPPKKGLNFGRILLYLLLGACVLFTLRACAQGEFWRSLGVVQAPATPATKSPSAAVTPTVTPTRTATVIQTKESGTSRATEPVDRIRDLVVLRILMLVLGGLALLLSALLAIQRKKVWARLALVLAVLLLLVGAAAWLAIFFSGPVAPTGTPTPTVDIAVDDAAKKTVEAKAPTATPTLVFEKRVETAVVATETAVAEKTAAAPTGTPTPTATTKPAAAPTATTKPPEPTKPAPKPEVVMKVTIEGFGSNLPGCLTLVFFQGNWEVKRLQVVSPSMTWSGQADRVKIEGGVDGRCPWDSWNVDQSEKGVQGEVKFKFTPKATPTIDRGKP